MIARTESLKTNGKDLFDEKKSIGTAHKPIRARGGKNHWGGEKFSAGEEECLLGKAGLPGASLTKTDLTRGEGGFPML